jgi:UDP-2,3-diacylglucosamine pyrophosphatase LpxH
VNHETHRTIISPDKHPVPLIMIADAHIRRRPSDGDTFFDMLAALERGPGDVVFIGDIFDLWIALPRYENALHRAFLSWCRRQKAHRRIGFIEGNHEFFLARGHATAFTWCTDLPWWRDVEGHLFCHGDRINRNDRNYLAFRKLTKNPVTKAIARVLPMGPNLVNIIKRRLKQTNEAFRKSLPLDLLQAFAEARFAEGVTRIFIGHFHQAFHYRGRQGGELNALPDWSSRGWISILPADRGSLQQGSWQKLLPTVCD